MKQAVTGAQAGKLSLHTRPSIQPTEQQMNESAVKAGVCLALCGGSAITTSAAVHRHREEGCDGMFEEPSICSTQGREAPVVIRALRC